MTMPPIDETPEPQPTPAAAETRPGALTLVAAIPNAGEEPPAHQTDREAQAIWSAVSALWHPSLLARAAALPRIESADAPSPPQARELRVVASGAMERLPSGYLTQAADAGATLFEGDADRDLLVSEIQERLGAVGTPETNASGEMASVALDYMALGSAHWWLKDLTTAMGHSDGLDHDSLTREVLAGATAWQNGDRPTATNRLRAAFELLTQARERFYPVDAYLIDICLLDPGMPAGSLVDPLTSRAPVSFLAPAKAIENLAARDPERLAALREAITEGWADVAGGAYAEADEPLLPLESVLWQFRKGGEVYRAHLDERNVETVARRRFALYPQLPQVAKRFGFRFAVHLGFDAGRFPVRPESKRLWEAPDGTSMETLTRPPLGADKAASGSRLPWRLALTMKDDHVATVALVHWPGAVAPWYLDLRRVAAYSPVLARWVTLNDYFHLTDRPFESFRPEPDQYVAPYLDQAVARQDPRPISRRAEHARLRARLDGLGTVQALARSLAGVPTGVDPASHSELEEAIETGRLDEARQGIESQESAWAGVLARGIVGGGSGGRPGYLVFNPLGVARRCPVRLPEAAPDLRPEGPLRAAQFTEDGVWGVVDLPAFGFAWVPRESDPETSAPRSSSLSVRERVLRNESLTVEVDRTTGGIRGLHSPSESTARLGQQLVMAGLSGSDGKGAATSRMVGESIEVDYGGPALVQVVSRGAVLGPGDARLASFHQRLRLWSGRPTLELEVTLGDLDAEWLDRVASADPWAHALACRWAWPDPNSMLRRTFLLSPELTESDRPETPDVLDVSTRRQRTALLFGGLAHHRRHGTRMLDTLLVAGREADRVFRLGVALDLEYPFHAAVDMVTPAIVVPTDAGLPPAGPTGWLFQLDNKGVAVTRVEYVDPSGDGRGWGIAFHLLETSGRPARCRLRTFRNPVWARQTDFHNELIVDLPVDGDAVMLDLTPHEIARVDVTLG
jgi:alpha-mannosidase